jgi:hypothetical protein
VQAFQPSGGASSLLLALIALIAHADRAFRRFPQKMSAKCSKGVDRLENHQYYPNQLSGFVTVFLRYPSGIQDRDRAFRIPGEYFMCLP